MPLSRAKLQLARLGLILLCGFTMLLPAAALAAQSGSGSATERGRLGADGPEQLDAATIRARIAVVEARTDVSEAERDLLLQRLRAALARVEATEAARKAALDYAQALQTAPQTIAALNAESLSSPPTTDVGDADDNPVQMQLRLASLQAEAVSLRSALRNLDESLRYMGSRPDEARAELKDLHQQLERQQAVIPTNASPALVEANKLLNDATRQELSARIERTEQELLSLPTRESIANAQRALAARRSTQVDAAIAVLNERITAQRRLEAEMQAAQALEFARKLAGQPQALRDYADRNTAIRESLKEVNERTVQVRRVQQTLRAQQAELSEARKNADQTLAIGRISDESGRLLRELQTNLLASDALQSRIVSREDAIVEAQVKRLQIRQQLRALRPADQAARHDLDEHQLAATDSDHALMQALVERRHSALSDLENAQAQYIAVLVETTTLDSQLMRESAQLRALLDEHLLWLPSTAPLGTAWVRQLGGGIAWLLAPSNWSRVPSVLIATMRTHWLIAFAWLLALIALFLPRSQLVALLEKLARPIGDRRDRFVFTIAACVVSLLLSLAWPLLIAAGGWLLRISGEPGGFARALAQGLMNVAIVWFMLGLFSDMCRPHGVFAAHFGWGAQGTQRLSRALRLLLLALVPAALLMGMTDASGRPELIDGIGRLAFMFGSLALAVFLYRVFRLRGGALTGGLRRGGWALRTRRVWTGVLVALPLLLIGLAAAGYYATARELQDRLFSSGWVALAVIIAFFVAMRGVVVASRRATWQQADARHARRLAEAAAGADADHGSDLLALQQQEPQIDAVRVSQQTRSLLRAIGGIVLVILLWQIWSGLLPALNVFNDVVLWSHLEDSATGAKVAVVTLGDILLSLLILAIAIIAARNLPGFLEVTLLQHLRIDAGTRYAISTIGRYALVGIGVGVAFSRIGLDWSQLQWFVAALGVGLGFGLQEIVANFISGLIILFERPVRVGDTVSIGSTVGTVSKIKIRAITITDFDNFEVTVPNKAFITGTVQNWSLPNEVTRLVIELRVAHGSDVEQTQQIMLNVARANPRVLPAPEPRAFFLAFGKHALEFELRAYVGSVADRVPTRHELHVALDAAFKAAGIELLFPQRDMQVLHTHVGPPEA